MTAPVRRIGVASNRWRAGIYVLIVFAFVGVIGYRLVSLQVVERAAAVEYGRGQRLDEVVLPASRGAIVDRNGVDLVLSVPARTVFADPKFVEDPTATAWSLATVVDVDVAKLAQKLSTPGSRFTFVARQLDDATADAIMALNLAGILEYEEPTRVHPSGDRLAISTVGRTDVDGVGISGLEEQYDDLLSGQDGRQVIERGTQGRSIPGGTRQVEPAKQGESLVLTLDRTLQFQAEQLMVDAVTRLDAKGGTLIAMDPGTGEILANATIAAPTDSATGQRQAPQVVGENRAATWTFEPGSVNKAFTFAAVFEEGLGRPDTAIEVPYSVERWDTEFEDAEKHDTVSWSIDEIVARSSNVGTILWGERLNNSNLHRYLKAFGFGEPTGLGFPGESSGSLPDVEDWNGLSNATIGFGQGVSVTPIQLISAYSTLANKGVSLPPSFVRGTRSADGTFDPFEPAASRRVISESSADAIVGSLTKVVNEGTGTNAAVPGYEVAGKTGTAWKIRPASEGGGYYGLSGGEFRYLASFIGFLPADDPQLAILVVIDEPARANYSGSAAAAPVFADFAHYAVRHLGVPSRADLAAIDQNERIRVPAPDRRELELADGGPIEVN